MRTKDSLIKTQRVAFQTLANGFKSNRISHAYLISGNIEKALKEMAIYLAKSVVCSNLSPLACEECVNCQRIEDSSYADYRFLDGSKESIKKQQIEELQEDFSKVSLEVDGKKIYIIHLIENASIGAVNSLLKFLEEPIDDVIAILTTQNISKVLPTIISRTQLIRLKDYSSYELENQLLNEGFDEEDSFIASKLFTNLEDAKEYLKTNDYLLIKDSCFEIMHEIAVNHDPILYNIQNNQKLLNTKEKGKIYLDIMTLFLKDIINLRTGQNIHFINHEKDLKTLSGKIKNINELLKLVLVYQGYLRTNVNLNLTFESLFYNFMKGVN